jgi:hypothetical protein
MKTYENGSWGYAKKHAIIKKYKKYPRPSFNARNKNKNKKI